MSRKLKPSILLKLGLYLYNPDSVWMIFNNIRLKIWNIKHFKSVICIFSMKASYRSLDPKLRSFYLNVFIFKLLVSP